MRPRTGHSLLELAIALTLIGTVAAAAAAPLQAARDRIAVTTARRELAAAVAATRGVAVAHGGARLVLEPGAARAWIETERGPRAGSELDLAGRHGVAMESTRSRIELRFDALGVGRLANTTVNLRRGRAEAQLVVSAYGRVRQ